MKDKVVEASVVEEIKSEVEELLNGEDIDLEAETIV